MVNLITDRQQEDVANRTKKGYYGYEDINRVADAVEKLGKYLEEYGYITNVEFPTKTWAAADVPNESEMHTYLENVRKLRDLMAVSQNIPDSMDKLTFSGANDIERALVYVDKAISYMERVFPRSGVYFCGAALYVPDESYSWEIVPIPQQAEPLTYNGQEQSPDWGIDDSKYIFADNAATNAGSYTAMIKPKSGYKWSDGTTAAKPFEWRIAKASGIIDLQPPALTMTKQNWQDTIVIHYNGDGEIRVRKNGNSLQMSVSGNKILLSSVSVGRAKILVEAAEGANYKRAPIVACDIQVTDVIRVEAASGQYYSGSTLHLPDIYR